MIVPQFWAEARAQHRGPGKQITVRRFGWSDVDEAAARIHAETRARDALAAVVAGAPLPRRERRVGYNGADGIPIREEILARHDDVVVTRNAYGAQCLNTPNVLIADIDLPHGPHPLVVVASAALLLAAAALAAWQWQSWQLLLFASLAAIAVASRLARVLHALRLRLLGGAAQLARQRIERFAARHSDWHLRVYRTPAGFRVLALHRLFDPNAPEVDSCFDALGVDRIYARMCRRQQCFRARLTAKPWRIGVAQHMPPRPGVWPIAEARRPARAAWVAAYERRAEGYAACAFVTQLGSTVLHHTAARVLQLHDAGCRADSDLPLA